MAGFQNRIKDIKSRSKQEIKGISIEPRHPSLRQLEGWYKLNHFDSNVLPESIRPLYFEWIKEGKRTKFIKWMLRKKYIHQDEAAQLGQIVGNQQSVSFKVSTKWNDIVRAPESRHYFSCFSGAKTRDWMGRSQHIFGERRGSAGWRGLQMLRYLADSEMGIVFIPDKSGAFLWRAYVRLCQYDSGNRGWALYRSYGNSPIPQCLIEDKLNSLCPLFNLTTKAEQVYNHRVNLKSIGAYNNPVAGYTIWSDHGMTFSEEDRKIHFTGIPYNGK